MAEVKEIGQDSFDQEVLNSSTPVLVDFWAPWCGPCKMVAPVLEEIASDYEGRLKVVKVNVDDNPDLASQQGIMSIPTLKLYREGDEVQSFVGAQSKDSLVGQIEELV